MEDSIRDLIIKDLNYLDDVMEEYGMYYKGRYYISDLDFARYIAMKLNYIYLDYRCEEDYINYSIYVGVGEDKGRQIKGEINTMSSFKYDIIKIL